MTFTNQAAEAEYSFDQALELAELSGSDYDIPWEAFDEETDKWPLYEPEANNFGDF